MTFALHTGRWLWRRRPGRPQTHPRKQAGKRPPPQRRGCSRRPDASAKQTQTNLLLAYDGDRIRDCGGVWENAVGKGHIAREIKAFGLPVTGADIVDRGWPGVIVKSFYDFTSSPQRAIITNPPFKEINARHGRGRWLKHLLSLPDWDYLALLLDWNWPAAVINGFAELMDQNPFSYTYLMRWKLDFTDEVSPPLSNE